MDLHCLSKIFSRCRLVRFANNACGRQTCSVQADVNAAPEVNHEETVCANGICALTDWKPQRS